MFNFTRWVGARHLNICPDCMQSVRLWERLPPHLHRDPSTPPLRTRFLISLFLSMKFEPKQAESCFDPATDLGTQVTVINQGSADSGAFNISFKQPASRPLGAGLAPGKSAAVLVHRLCPAELSPSGYQPTG